MKENTTLGETGKSENGLEAKKKGLRLWHCILLVGLVGSLPMVLVCSILINRSISREIDFARLEKVGNAYEQPLVDLLDELPRHQYLAARAQAGDTNASAQLPALRQEIDKHFADLTAVDALHGKTLKFTDAELKKRDRADAKVSIAQMSWEAIKTGNLAADALAQTNATLMGNIRKMITHAGDLSNLILDPELDSYYMSDITLGAIPQTQQRLSDSILSAADWLRKHETEAHKADIAIFAAMLQQDDEDRITGDSQTALKEDASSHGLSPTLQSNLPPAIDKYAKASQRYLKLLQSILEGKHIPEPESLEVAAWETRAAAHELWVSSRAELDLLLEARLRDLQAEQWMDYGLIALLQMINIGVILYIVRKLKSQLSGLMDGLVTTSSELSSATAQISASSRQLAEGVSKQASSLEEASASLEQISGMTGKNAETSKSTRQFAQLTLKAAEAAARSTGEMDSATQSIRAAGTEMQQAMEGITSSNNNVAKIIKTIDEIAFQTNILALNAAVEAARAGEAGLGFSVVADEVRNLAQRSAKAARETSALIEAAIKQSETGSTVNDKVSSAVEDMVAKSKIVAERLQEILNDVRKMDSQINEVSSACVEQSEGLTHLSKAVHQVDEVTQQNSCTADESAMSTGLLRSQSEHLSKIVNNLAFLMGRKEAVSSPKSKPAVSGQPKSHSVKASHHRAGDTLLSREELSKFAAEAKGDASGGKIPMPNDHHDSNFKDSSDSMHF